MRNVTLTFFTNHLKCFSYHRGGMAERLNALVLKTSKGSNLSRVRIPVPPPLTFVNENAVTKTLFYSSDSKANFFALYSHYVSTEKPIRNCYDLTLLDWNAIINVFNASPGLSIF